MKRRKNFVRALFILVGMAIGYYYLPPLWVTLGIKLHSPLVMMIVNVAIGAIIFGLLSLSLTDWVLRVGKRIEHNLAQKSPLYLIMGAITTILGLILAALISIPLWRLRIPVINNVLPILLMVIFSYFGFLLGTTRLDEWRKLLFARREKPKDGAILARQDANYHHYKILDTNILIDGRDKRNHPTRTVYLVAYRATDGSGYTYRSAAGAAEQTARQIVAAGEPVTRRVLSVPQDGVSVTVEADQTAQSYVAGQRKTYGAMAGASLAYLLIWAAVHIGVAYRRRRQGRHSKRTGE